MKIDVSRIADTQNCLYEAVLFLFLFIYLLLNKSYILHSSPSITKKFVGFAYEITLFTLSCIYLFFKIEVSVRCSGYQRKKNRAANDTHFISGKKKWGKKMNLQRMNSWIHFLTTNQQKKIKKIRTSYNRFLLLFAFLWVKIYILLVLHTAIIRLLCSLNDISLLYLNIMKWEWKMCMHFLIVVAWCWNQTFSNTIHFFLFSSKRSKTKYIVCRKWYRDCSFWNSCFFCSLTPVHYM